MASNPNQTQDQINRMSESAQSAINRAAEVAQQLSERSDEYLAMKDEYVEAAREYVRENPLFAVGVALAAGYLFGKLTSWR